VITNEARASAKGREADASPSIGTMEKYGEELVLPAEHESPVTAGRGMSTSSV